MNRPSLRRTLFLLLLTATLVTQGAGAADLGPATSSHQAGASLAPLNFLDQIWSLLTGFWNKEGCILDPSGLQSMGGTGSGEAGCILDPSGLCAAATPVQGEEGCILDPNGRCGG
jgi:hypothetical protein